LLFIFIISCSSVACSNKAKEFDLQCQGGWDEQLALSNTIYNKLSEHKYTRYLSVKMGDDRGSYSLNFLGQTADSGVFLHANENEIVTNSISLTEVEKAFAFLPKDLQSLKGYTGSGDVWVHLSCEYMKIKTSGYTTILSFHDHILKESLIEPVSNQSVAALVKLKNYFKYHLLETAKKRSDNLNVINVNTIASLNKDAVMAIKNRKTSHRLFYEIP